MAVFNLKYRDTAPILEVVLKNPDGSVHDLTGTTSWKLHIRLSGASVPITVNMAIHGPATDGTLRYTWLATDWDTGKLIVGEHRMEYEVVAGTVRMTFPNGSYDTLKIVSDLGQA